MLINRTVIVCNGELKWTAPLAAVCRGASAVLAADGGANALARIGVRPNVVVGDMDSILDSTRAWIGEDRMEVRSDQNSTDLEKTLDFVLGAGDSPEIAVLGALGGRLDHIVGNLATLARHCLGTGLLFVTATEIVMAIDTAVNLEALPGEVWAVWSNDPAVRIATEGLEWSPEGRDCSRRPSTSNRAVAHSVRVTPEGGTALVMRGVSPEFWSAL